MLFSPLFAEADPSYLLCTVLPGRQRLSSLLSSPKDRRVVGKNPEILGCLAGSVGRSRGCGFEPHIGWRGYLKIKKKKQTTDDFFFPAF